MKTSDVSFDELRELLLELGFREIPQTKPRFKFEHPVGGTFLFPRYKPGEKVSLGDMLVVRGQLDYNGLIDASAFDRSLHKTPA
jgi:hypothetical protein